LSNLVLLGIAASLAMDAFAVAVAASVTLGRVQPRQAFRLVFHFGLFQAIMPLVGWAAGRTVADSIAAYDHWAAFVLLAVVGGKAIVSALRDGAGDVQAQRDPTRGLSLVGLSVATSLDALAVGLSFSFLHVRIWTAVLLIGVVAAAATLVGMTIGSRLGLKFGKVAEVVGGCVLIGIGVRIVLDHAGVC
jgi:putative Mn2+ efflux pump MntP